MDIARASELMKALGHPLRLKIVCGLLSKKGCNVNDIAAALKAPQPTVSQQLGILRRSGIIAPHKHGVRTCYTIIDARVEKIVKFLQ